MMTRLLGATRPPFISCGASWMRFTYVFGVVLHARHIHCSSRAQAAGLASAIDM